MAKIEIELPDDLLRQIDQAVARAGESRDHFLRRLIEAEVAGRRAQFREELEGLMQPPLDLGGKTAVELIREGRDGR